MRRRQETTEMLKESMGDALLSLMKEKPLEKITIEEMTAKADVGRVTYFRYFKSKDEVLAFKFRKLWERYTTENGKVDLRERSFAAREYFAFSLSMRDPIDLEYERGHQEAVLIAVLEVIRSYYEVSDTAAEYARSYYADGLFGLFNTWVRHGYQETPEEMANIFMGIK